MCIEYFQSSSSRWNRYKGICGSNWKGTELNALIWRYTIIIRATKAEIIHRYENEPLKNVNFWDKNVIFWCWYSIDWAEGSLTRKTNYGEEEKTQTKRNSVKIKSIKTKNGRTNEEKTKLKLLFIVWKSKIKKMIKAICIALLMLCTVFEWAATQCLFSAIENKV